ncbi:MAG: thiolase family protein [Thermoanaerobaculia bacterium]
MLRTREPVFLIAPVRTPIGKFGGALAKLTAADLGTAAAEACLERAGVSGEAVDQTIFGHARQAGGGPNTARQAAETQNRCQAARESGRFDSEIVPIEVPGRRETITVDKDEHPRDGVVAEKLAKLKPVFRDGGTVTAGNASGITDGASAVLVASADAVKKHGLEPVARLVDWEVVGVDPRIMGIGPVPAVKAIMGRNELAYGEIDQIEINEAFASQVLACLEELPFERDRVNPDGGAIALGHPIGCTGTRILVTLLHGLAHRGGTRGIATHCVSGGMGLAALVETTSEAP